MDAEQGIHILEIIQPDVAVPNKKSASDLADLDEQTSGLAG
jgi:hypothetical protein